VACNLSSRWVRRSGAAWISTSFHVVRRETTVFNVEQGTSCASGHYLTLDGNTFLVPPDRGGMRLYVHPAMERVHSPLQRRQLALRILQF